MPIATVPQELVFDTHALGAQARCLEALGAAAPSPGPRMLQAWSTEYGPLNRVVSLWEGAPVGTPPERGRAVDWLDGQRVTRALLPRRPVAEPLLASPLLELRMYAARDGRCEDFVAALLAALPYRERYSPCVGLWTTEEREADVVVHLWAYASFEARMQARARAMADPDWGRYRASIPPLLRYMQAMLLVPLAAPAGTRTDRARTSTRSG